MIQIMKQLSEAWDLADDLLRKNGDPEEKAQIRERMRQIGHLMEQTMRRTFDTNELEFQQAIAAFKQNRKDIEEFKRSLDRSTQAIRFLTDIVARVDSLLQNIPG